MIGLPYGEKNYDDMLIGFHTIPACYGQTDRQTDGRTDGRTDGQNCYIRIDKNGLFLHHLRLMYPRMSQMKGRSKKNSAGSARSIVLSLYPHSQSCGAALITMVSWVHLITTNYCPLKFCPPSPISIVWLCAWSCPSGFLVAPSSDLVTVHEEPLAHL